jgi:hypothetical protein
MRRRATQVLVLLGICMLCFAITAFAQNNQGGNNNNQGDNNNNQGGNNNNRRNPISAPEIDVGSAAGALTIAGGTLMLLRERLRRQ